MFSNTTVAMYQNLKLEQYQRCVVQRLMWVVQLPYSTARHLSSRQSIHWAEATCSISRLTLRQAGKREAGSRQNVSRRSALLLAAAAATGTPQLQLLLLQH